MAKKKKVKVKKIRTKNIITGKMVTVQQLIAGDDPVSYRIRDKHSKLISSGTLWPYDEVLTGQPTIRIVRTNADGVEEEGEVNERSSDANRTSEDSDGDDT